MEGNKVLWVALGTVSCNYCHICSFTVMLLCWKNWNSFL